MSMRQLVLVAALAAAFAACGDNKAKPDASVHPDAANPDAKDIDAAIPDGIAGAKGTTDGTGLSLPIHNVTITYLKPQIGSTTNDPAGFTIQAQHDGPALFVS